MINLRGFRVEAVRNSCEGEADKETSFAAIFIQKCLYNYTSGLNSLAASERCKGVLRPSVEQTIGDAKTCTHPG